MNYHPTYSMQGLVAAMGILALISTALVNSVRADKAVANVLAYGAVGDGKTDDTSAFLKAWSDICNSSEASNSTSPVMLIPGAKTFSINSINFTGPCKSSPVTIILAGKIIAPDTPNAWNGPDLIRFEGVNGLVIKGNGSIDGNGKSWWDVSCRDHPTLPGCHGRAPTSIIFLHCSNVHMERIFFKNSPQTHILVWQSQDVELYNFNVNSPASSPNTDGVHLQDCSRVQIRNAIIKSGDDCISVGDQVYNLNISDIFCGPGHGISIGSLGGENAVLVENVTVHRVHFFGTQNGARIKTKPLGKGNVRRIEYVNMTFHQVQNPIIIYQHYCFSPDGCPEKDTAVDISNVKFIASVGTSASEVAINLNCSSIIPCTNITLEAIQLTSSDQKKQVSSSCHNAFGSTDGIVKPQSCLSSPRIKH